MVWDSVISPAATGTGALRAAAISMTGGPKCENRCGILAGLRQRIRGGFAKMPRTQCDHRLIRCSAGAPFTDHHNPGGCLGLRNRRNGAKKHA